MDRHQHSKFLIDAYREASKQAGHDPTDFPIATAGFFYVAETTQQAQREAYPHINLGMQMTNGRGYPKQQFAQGADTRDVMNIGSPQQMIEKILYQYEMFGHQRYIAQMDFGGMPFDKLMKNIELIGNEILPAVKKYTAKERRNKMKIVGLSGSKVGSKTRTAMDYTIKEILENILKLK